jgi:hypothetical protein
MHSVALIFLSVLLCSPLAAQRGGGAEILYQFDGFGTTRSFGNSFACAGDVDADGTPDLVIGDASAIGGWGLMHGEVYVYSGATGLRLHRITGHQGDSFGNCVDGVGDVNGDGYDDFIVGAPSTNVDSFQSSGSAYVYSGLDGALLFRFDGEAPAVVQSFGRAVSGLGDINHDGINDFLIGASGTIINNQSYVGSVFAYSGADGALLYRFDGDLQGDSFGYGIDDAGDVNADGVTDIYVGAASASRNGYVDAGLIRIFSGADGALLHEIIGEGYSRRLGASGGGAGDVNGDGFDDIVTSAHSQLGGLDGAALVYSGKDGSVLHRVDANNLYPEVCGPGDIDGDGFDDIALGSSNLNPGGPNSGAVYAISGATGSILHRFFVPNTSAQQLGWALAGACDINGDGLADIIAGAAGSLTGSGRIPGAIYVFSFDPQIHIDTYRISAAQGGPVTLDIDFPSAESGYQYRVLMSFSGTGPSSHGVLIPLTVDFMFHESSRGIYPFQNYSGMRGVLDLNGNATANINIGPNEIPARLVGRHCWFAAVISQSASMQAEFTSVAVPLKIGL